MFLLSNFHQNAFGSVNGLHQIKELEGGSRSFLSPAKANSQRKVKSVPFSRVQH